MDELIEVVGKKKKHRMFRCKRCGRETKHKDNLRIHIRRRHMDGAGFLSCPHPGCATKCRSQSLLDIHMRSHTGKRPFKCLEPSCFAAFLSNGQLTKHSKIHDADDAVTCTFLNCRFRATPTSVALHYNRIHIRRLPPTGRRARVPRYGTVVSADNMDGSDDDDDDDDDDGEDDFYLDHQQDRDYERMVRQEEQQQQQQSGAVAPLDAEKEPELAARVITRGMAAAAAASSAGAAGSVLDWAAVCEVAKAATERLLVKEERERMAAEKKMKEKGEKKEK